MSLWRGGAWRDSSCFLLLLHLLLFTFQAQFMSENNPSKHAPTRSRETIRFTIFIPERR
jgi:hypothetical protein